MQPRHATADAVVAEREWGARCARAYAWADLQRAGATLAFGSDAPVETLAPLVGIHAAVTRRGPDGGPAWHPEQRLSLEDALRAYTVGAAAASADPEATGTLQPGAPADFVVLSGDPFALPASELLSLRVEATGVGGRWAFRAPGFPPDR
jgi:predicted amidohydrolase YtcJ